MPKVRFVLPDKLFQGRDIEAHRRIDRIVREKAFSSLSKWPEDRKIFLNMLPDHFLCVKDIEKDSHVLKTCRKYGVANEQVVIEITERATDRFPEIIPILKEYAEMGFTIAIDDWGAEYSNFDRLASLMPSVVKFDARFLWRATSNPSIAEIFCAAVSMALKLGIQVVVEGVETEEHLYMALDAGCPMAQGFLFARPAVSIPDQSRFIGLLDKAFYSYREGKVRHLIKEKKKIRYYVDNIVETLSSCINKGIVYEDLLKKLHQLLPFHGEIINAYILNHCGIQISPNFFCTSGNISLDENMVNRDWSWRPYYIRTTVNRQLFESKYTITGPYIDPNNGKSMHTVCIVMDQYMLCMDLSIDMVM
jgi:EAL domain-containing protein (putative c-di-GMP-specific phosphodiesterase class I)